MTVVGFVGAGQLGEPMVERLVEAGNHVVVYARKPDVRERLASLGAKVVDTTAAAAAGAEVVILCLFSDTQLAEVGPEAVAAMPPGSVLASHVTGTTKAVTALADAGKERGVAVLDAPVSGTAEAIRAGRLTVLLGGAGKAVAQATSVIQAYADPVIPTGPLGSALAVKLVNNLLFAANNQLLAAASQLAGDLGVAEPDLLSALARCSGGSAAATYAAGFPSLQSYGEQMAPFIRKDLAACRAAADDLGVEVPSLLLDVVQRGPLPLT